MEDDDNMNDAILQVFSKGLQGHNAHVHPLKSVKGLTAEKARTNPSDGVRSCWEQLYHMVYWQDLVIEDLKGGKVDFAEASKHDWPEAGKMGKDADWPKLIQRFEEGINEMGGFVNKDDISRPIESWNNLPVAKAVMVIIQHNSYHIGEIVVARKSIGLWPPEE
ncbi:MAG: DinB family protein [Candidatus Thorarchaeota archaeon]